jgi:hypothetical protein
MRVRMKKFGILHDFRKKFFGGRVLLPDPWGQLEKFLTFYFRIISLLLENEWNVLLLDQ